MTLEQIKEMFVLDPITHKVRHNPDRPRSTFQNDRSMRAFKSLWAGKPVAFHTNSIGYQVSVSMRVRSRITFSEHHLVYVLHNDKQVDPGNIVDHINRVKDDNRPENLREISRSENAGNSIFFLNDKESGEGKKRMKYSIECLADGSEQLELYFADGQCFFSHVFETRSEVEAAINGANIVADWAINSLELIPPNPPVYAKWADQQACVLGGNAMGQVFDAFYAVAQDHPSTDAPTFH